MTGPPYSKKVLKKSQLSYNPRGIPKTKNDVKRWLESINRVTIPKKNINRVKWNGTMYMFKGKVVNRIYLPSIVKQRIAWGKKLERLKSKGPKFGKMGARAAGFRMLTKKPWRVPIRR